MRRAGGLSHARRAAFGTSGMIRNWGESPQRAIDRAESNSRRQLRCSRGGKEVEGQGKENLAQVPERGSMWMHDEKMTSEADGDAETQSWIQNLLLYFFSVLRRLSGGSGENSSHHDPSVG